MRRVMVGTDRSETAERAVRWAAGFADRFEADLFVVQVVVPQHPAGTEYGAAEHTQAGAAAADLQHYARELAGERGHAKVVVDDDPAMAIVQATEDEEIDVLVVGNAGMAGRKEFLLGNVPNRISHSARCTVIIVNTFAADGKTGATRDAPGDRDPRRRDPRDGAAPHGARLEDRLRHGQARPEGALRPPRRGRHHRQAAPGEAPARGPGGAGADVLETRAGAVHAARPAAARVHRGARVVAGPRAAAPRGAGRDGDGAGARRAVGGRVRLDRPEAARRRHDRTGAPGDARQRRPRRREGAASRRAGGHRAGPRAAGAVRREGVRPQGAQAGDRHGRRVRAPVDQPAPGARLPAGGREHRAHARGDRRLHAAGRARRVRGPVDLAVPGDAGDPGRVDRGGARGLARAQGGGTPAPRVLLQADPHRRLLPRRPSPREPDVVARLDLLPGLRDGGRGRRRHARAPDAAADGVLAGGPGLPHRRDADAGRRGRPQRPRRGQVPGRDRRADGEVPRSCRCATSSWARSCRR